VPNLPLNAKVRNATPGQRPPNRTYVFAAFGGRWPGIAFLVLASWRLALLLPVGRAAQDGAG
jgi:hypothetical protein